MTKCDVVNAAGDPNIGSLGCVAGNILEALLLSVGFVSAVFLILSGIKLVTSQGDPKALASAKGKFTWAIVGFILAISAIAIVRLIGNFVGYDLLPNSINIDTTL